MSADWVGAWGQWAGAIMTFLAVFVTLRQIRAARHLQHDTSSPRLVPSDTASDHTADYNRLTGYFENGVFTLRNSGPGVAYNLFAFVEIDGKGRRIGHRHRLAVEDVWKIEFNIEDWLIMAPKAGRHKDESTPGLSGRLDIQYLGPLGTDYKSSWVLSMQPSEDKLVIRLYPRKTLITYPEDIDPPLGYPRWRRFLNRFKL